MSYDFRVSDTALGMVIAGFSAIATARAAASFTVTSRSDKTVSNRFPVQTISHCRMSVGEETICCPAKLTFLALQQINLERDPSRLTMEYKTSASLLHAPACRMPGR